MGSVNYTGLTDHVQRPGSLESPVHYTLAEVAQASLSSQVTEIYSNYMSSTLAGQGLLVGNTPLGGKREK